MVVKRENYAKIVDLFNEKAKKSVKGVVVSDGSYSKKLFYKDCTLSKGFNGTMVHCRESWKHSILNSEDAGVESLEGFWLDYPIGSESEWDELHINGISAEGGKEFPIATFKESDEKGNRIHIHCDKNSITAVSERGNTVENCILFRPAEFEEKLSQMREDIFELFKDGPKNAAVYGVFPNGYMEALRIEMEKRGLLDLWNGMPYYTYDADDGDEKCYLNLENERKIYFVDNWKGGKWLKRCEQVFVFGTKKEINDRFSKTFNYLVNSGIKCNLYNYE